MFLLIFFSNNEIIIFVTQSSVSSLRRSAVLKPKEGSSDDRMLRQVLGAKRGSSYSSA